MTFKAKLFELLSSMRFAVSVLTVVSIASIIGTVLKQNEPYNNYLIQFGPYWFDFFKMLGMYDIYHAAWFLAILLFLVISVSLCVYRQSPQIIKDVRQYKAHLTESSLKQFSRHQTFALAHRDSSAQAALLAVLQRHGYRWRSETRADGALMIAAKTGNYQKLGYIFTHVAIIIICVGGLMDGNVPLKIQELLGDKTIETRDIPVSQVPASSKLSVRNLSFRANLTLPEGSRADVAFERVRDGYMVQQLPFAVALEDFRIEHYPTGQPKSFESDLVIIDPALKQPLKQTIKVNHPLTYKGITIYQSDFQDGGTGLSFNAWDLLAQRYQPLPVTGKIFEQTPIGEGKTALQLEFEDFKKFNVLNLSKDSKAKPRNVGPSVVFKMRDSAGQAKEYLNYMQPLQLDGQYYFVSGMRATPQEDYKYLRIPADQNLLPNSFMLLRASMADSALHQQIAHRMASDIISKQQRDANTQAKFEASVQQLLSNFAQGGFVQVANLIERSVPNEQREQMAKTYVKIISLAAQQAYQLGMQKHPELTVDKQLSERFLQDSLNSMSDIVFYGSPVYLQLTEYQHREASGLQLTRSPGKNLVYLGSILLVIGIFAMMYIRERRVWLLFKADATRVLVAMSANRKNTDFEQDYANLMQQFALALAHK